MKQFILVFLIFIVPNFSWSQSESYSYSKIEGGKLKYEFFVHKSRTHLIDSFFELYAENKSEWAIQEGSCAAVARKTRKGFEIVGDGEKQEFDCEMAELLIDLWYEFAHVNSN